MDKDKKDLQNIIKYYFSSLTARRCSFLYTGITKSFSEFILCNLEPDKLVKFCDATLAFHIVSVKQPDHIKSIKHFFQFIGLTNNEPYITKVTTILSKLNKVKFDFDQIELKKDNAGIIYYEDEEKGKVAIAWPNIIFQCIQMLNKFYDKYNLLTADNDTLQKICPVAMDIIVEDLNKAGVVIKSLDTSEYKNPDGTNMFEEKLIQKFDICLMDGADIISTKEVFKKADDESICRLLTWVRDGYIEYISTYETPTHQVVSIRPHVRYYIKQNMQKRKKK